MAKRAQCGSLLVLLAAGCGNSSPLITGPVELQWSPQSLSLVCSAGQSQGVITLSNPGSSEIDLASVGLTGDARSAFALLGSSPQRVAGFGTATVTVVYAPPSPGSDSAQLLIRSDAPNPNVSISLQGSCAAATSSGTTGGSGSTTTTGGHFEGNSGGTTSTTTTGSGTTSSGTTGAGTTSTGTTGGATSGGPSDSGILTVLGMSTNPAFLTVDANNVYWTDEVAGEVYRAPLSGLGPSTPIATGQDTPQGIVLQGGNVYWVDNESFTVDVAPIGGGGRALTTSLNNLQLAVNQTTIFWTTAQGTLEQMPIDGGTVTPFATGETCYGIALDSQNLYWSNQHVSGNNPSIRRGALNGGGIVTIASGLGSPALMAIDGTNAYWTDIVNGTVNQVSLDGGTVKVLASGFTQPWGIAVDATTVYFDDEMGGTIYSVPIDGGALTTLAIGQGFPYGVAVDDTSVYWANQLGQVMKLTPK